MTARNMQFGGDHYKKKAYQPWDLWISWRPDPFCATAIKYVLRWRDKGGIEDLQKAIHTLEFYKEIPLEAKDPVIPDRGLISPEAVAFACGMSPAERKAIQTLQALAVSPSRGAIMCAITDIMAIMDEHCQPDQGALSTLSSQINLRRLANGQPCQVRIPGYCNHNAETTVLAHYRLDGLCGTGLKPPDIAGAFSCSSCHDCVDGRINTPYTREQLRLWHAEGVIRTNCLVSDATPSS